MTTPLRLIQLRTADGARQVVAARGGEARVVDWISSTRELALLAIQRGSSLAATVDWLGLRDEVDLRAELDANRLLPAIDHPDPARLMLSGTGLTHLGSAESRDKMHRVAADKQTDSMRMFLDGLEGGKPAPGARGQQPEWFYKGDGTSLVGPGEPLTMPAFAQDGGEEPELAGIYLIGPDGAPYRLGVALANEFSDHITERHNYLWLAHSKLRNAALGAELLVGVLPRDIHGKSSITRAGTVIWSKPFLSGEENMSHAIANLEAHHFKYVQFRRPGDIHVHFFGTATLSFADGVCVQVGDAFEIEAAPFTLPLRNVMRVGEEPEVVVRAL